jgi:hypothetical protein
MRVCPGELPSPEENQNVFNRQYEHEKYENPKEFFD